VKPYLLLRAAELTAQRPSGEVDDVHFTEALAESVIADATVEGDLVLDPFAGYGTTLAVAERIDASLTPAQKLRDSAGTPADWANESLDDARSIYGQINGAYLARDYAQRQRGLVTDRLAKAGLRLAALLNKILK